ncbi:ester cyclase [Streptomyces johnsoniae]|uniref:Ester cyclase n=1 Tax=Streptomyces johnsoniae TaxID=3075532 RepID=A0ABU2S7Q7_9ACTN|nr:ester cyclase [Streptomyces sp. DSM 41886]MDT0445011.1 ester cyclase [Streptomyces sp. DSM 41886]
MSADQLSRNKATFNRLQEAFGGGDTELMSRTIDEVFRPDALIHMPLPVESTGAQAITKVFTTLHRAFPDLHIAVEDLIAEGDKVVCRNTVTGTHRGEFMGVPPTGTSITYREIFIGRFTDGRVAETWGVVDLLSLMRQLGVAPGGFSPKSPGE